MPNQFLEIEFPRRISYGSKGGPGFNTTVFTADSGSEQRNQNWQDAKAIYDVSYGITSHDDMEDVVAMFYNVRGRAIGFRYFDWGDYRILAQKIGEGDGATTAFQIIKEYTTGSYTYTRLIKKPIDPSLSGVTVNAVAKVEDVDFTVDYATGIITFVIAPGMGDDVVVGDVQFNVPVRFDIDTLPITQDAFLQESADGIKLVEVRL